jgi:pimeloyl-ACP methyl ester carboxylesterase
MKPTETGKRLCASTSTYGLVSGSLRSVTTYVLIPGAGGQAWYWHRLVPELQQRGHDVVAVDLPADDDSAGLAEYADAVVEAIGDRTQLILVAQSLGGFTAPLVCERLPVDLLVLLNAMVPAPGESAGDWWTTTGHAGARAEQAARDGRDPDDDPHLLDAFFHDVPPEVTAEAIAAGEPVQSGTPFVKPWPLKAWPDVPTRFLQGRDDRFFPLEFQRRLVRDRLGMDVDEMPGGHLLALSQPQELARRLEAYRMEAR